MEFLRNDTKAAADRFPATRWSVVDAARGSDPVQKARALDTLFAAYWKPVYKYVRLRWNCSPEDAQDLTQGFFAEVLQRALLARYDPVKSRLRTYLRLCADSFVQNEHKAATRQKRGGNATHLALDFHEAEGELRAVSIDPGLLASPESLEEFFEKEWIRNLFSLAVQDLRNLCEQRHREQTFRLFEDYDLSGDSEISYEKLSERYALPVTDVTNSLAWARREFRKIALDRLREMCGSEDEFRREAHAIFGWNAR